MTQGTMGCEWRGHGDGERSVKEVFQTAGFGSEEGYLLNRGKGRLPRGQTGRGFGGDGDTQSWRSLCTGSPQPRKCCGSNAGELFTILIFGLLNTART